MFNLEQSIGNWRRQMLAAGIKISALEELEGHLREEMERQIKSGQNQQQPFEIAMKKIGPGPELKNEFKKIGEPLAARLAKLMGIGCWAISFMLSLWCLIWVFHQPDLMPMSLSLAAAAASILCWKYSHKFLPAIRQKFIRAMIGFAGCVGGVIWMQLFIKEIFPGLTVHPAGTEVPEGRLLTAALWACTAMAVLSSIGYGLEKAAHEREIANS